MLNPSTPSLPYKEYGDPSGCPVIGCDPLLNSNFICSAATASPAATPTIPTNPAPTHRPCASPFAA